MKPIESILISSNGQVAVFNEDGQIGELQENVVCAIAEKAFGLGVDMDGKTILLDGYKHIRFFKTSDDPVTFNFESA